MKTCTLFNALADAQARVAGTPAIRPLNVTDDTTLLAALRNSATDRDQIIQRRINFGTGDETLLP